MPVFDSLGKILGIYAILLIFAGTFLNSLSVFICFRIKKNATFIFLGFFSFFNLFNLFWWNLNIFLTAFTDINLILLSVWLCKFGNFVQFSSLQIPAWFLVLISVERVLSVFVKHWKTIHFKPKRAFKVSIIMATFFLLLNSNILVLFGFETNLNGTHLLFCFKVDGFPATYWMSTYGQIHSVGLYSLIPFSVLSIANLVLIVKVFLKSKVFPKRANLNTDNHTSSSTNKFNKMNKNVLILTFLFIAFTLPIACASFFFDELFKTEWGNFLIILLDW